MGVTSVTFFLGVDFDDDEGFLMLPASPQSDMDVVDDDDDDDDDDPPRGRELTTQKYSTSLMFEFFSLSRAFDRRLIFRRVSADPAGWDDDDDEDPLGLIPPPPLTMPPPLLFARERLAVAFPPMASIDIIPVAPAPPRTSLLDVLDRGKVGGWGDIGLLVIADSE